MNKVNIICMKWGDKFPVEYVNRLFGMVSRHLSIPFRFVCFTENNVGIRDEIEIQDLPELDLPSGLPERGWRKLTVFKKDFSGLSGPTLFLDLDIVVVGNLNEFFTHPGDFLIAHDKKNPKKIEGNSSIFRFEIGQHPEILSFFEQNPELVKSEVRHEQAYLSREMRQQDKLRYWPDEWVPSFKYRCCPSWIKSWFQAPFIPKGAKVILFHGLPNPPEAIIGRSGKWYRHIQPSPWIEKYWKI
ncbi:glycosyltransferase [Abyssogena phaseoliformis symbiont OG214]|uniref:glycosyltransferase n=1 Tax=Abyssogena phaseoliformis symbiont TaxID=596095 RepID=UPI0019158A6D|nr:glycosyltransferase [Abyssogena phaseoliformis symbiont]BBB23028.1 glycosyltransferase [Abyssogena phaseoliformis symbiont OG214]